MSHAARSDDDWGPPTATVCINYGDYYLHTVDVTIPTAGMTCTEIGLAVSTVLRTLAWVGARTGAEEPL